MFARLGISGKERDQVELSLRMAKRNSWDDEQVMDQLREHGATDAVRFEEARRADNRLDYDDLLRHADRLLQLGGVRHLYQLHFAAVFVDELQDLTLQQWRIAKAVGLDRLTCAGDRGQGIYGFAGAQPEEVFNEVLLGNPAVFELSASFRAAPRLIDAVNAVSSLFSQDRLTCADPMAWPDPGTLAHVERSSFAEEAVAIADLLAQPGFAGKSIGVISRMARRREVVEREVASRGIDFEVWGTGIHNPRITMLLRRFSRQAVSHSADVDDQLSQLEELCAGQIPPDDVELLDDLVESIELLRETLQAGIGLEDAIKRCRNAPPSDAAVTTGIHFLTGHAGKGQQFDWVVVLGMEDGTIPDFRAESEEALLEEAQVLHVMISRAREGLVVTRVRWKPTRFGDRETEPSRWLERLMLVGFETW